MKIRVLVLLFIILPLINLAGSRSNMTVQLRAYSGKSRLKNVTYTLYVNHSKKFEKTETKGLLQFIIHPGDELVVIIAEKEGYITKELQFPAKDYKFKEDYAVQEIDLIFDEGLGNEVQAGLLEFTGSKYRINRTNSLLADKALSAQETNEEVSTHQSIAKADTAIEIQEEGNPDFLAFTDTDRGVEEEPETTEEFNFSSTTQKEYYSVQIGAFSNKVNTKAFSQVPDFKTIEDLDYIRCFSGKFNSKTTADKRRDELRELGFIDAFVVKFRGNERVDF
tara:strand:- start:7521 stop:8357 length:837 start_codon:yes stop_codon:yes gene_type:complete